MQSFIRIHYTCSPGSLTRISGTSKLSLLLVLLYLSISLSGYGQSIEKPFSVTFNKTSMKQVLRQLETVSRFHFVYSDEDINNAGPVSGTFSGKPISEILSAILAPNQLTYQTSGNTVIIKKRTTPATPAKGKLSGIIKDRSTGEALIGVEVQLQGAVTQTDTAGGFSLELPVGDYKVTLSYTGYTGIEQAVSVNAGKETWIAASMSQDNSTDIGEVLITERRPAGTNIAMIQEIRNANAIISGISREQIDQSQDRDAAEVVKRVPGVSIIQNRFIIIRGLPQRYNTVLLNDAFAPSFEPDSRAFSFDIMPSNLIDRIMIYKTATPELPGDFSGGIVKVYTTGIPVRNSFNVTYQVSYRPNTSFRDFYEQPGGAAAWIGYDKTYHMPNAAADKRIDQMSLSERQAITSKFNNHWNALPKTAGPDQRFSVDFSRRLYLPGNTTLGITGGLSYTNMRQYTIVYKSIGKYNNGYRNINGIVDRIFWPDYKFTDQRYSHDIRLNGLFNVSLDINKKNRIEFKNLYMHLAKNTYTNRNGQSGMDAPDGIGLSSNLYINQMLFNNSFKEIFSSQINGFHEFDRTHTKVNWVAAYNRSDYNDPDQRFRTRVSPVKSYYGDDSSWVEHMPAGGQIGRIYWSRFYFTLPEEKRSLSIDMEQQLSFGAFTPLIKAGVFHEYKNRSFSFRALGLSSQNDTIAITEAYSPANSYTAQNNYQAGYLAILMPITSQLSIYTGLRVEKNRQQLQSHTWQTIAGPNGEVNLDHNITSFLPSMNINYRFRERNLVRLAYAKTLNRPEFREIAPFAYTDLENYVSAFGNEKLLPQTDIHNVDLRYEYYPGTNEMLSAALFYKYFRNPVEFYYFVTTGNPNSFQWHNAENAISYGVELEAMVSLAHYFKGNSFFSRQMQKVSFYGNASYVYTRISLFPAEDTLRAQVQKASRPLLGQSPYLVNSTLTYTDDSLGLQAAVSYNIIGKRIIGVGNYQNADIWELPRHALDFTFCKRIARYLELRLGIQNILNARFIQMQDADGNNQPDRNARDIDLQDFGKFEGYTDNRYLSWYQGAYYTLSLNFKLQ